MLKKTTRKVLILILAVIICLAGCDSNAGKRPSNYKNTLWQEQSMDFCFWVDDKYYETTGTNTYGVILMNDSKMPVYLLFGYDNSVSVMPLSSYRKEIVNGKEDYYCFAEEYLFEGIGDFKKNSFTVTITDDRGYLPEGTTELHFVREDLPE